MEVDYRKFESALRKLGQGVEDDYTQNDRPVEKERMSVDDLIAIHDKAVELYGGEYGVRDPGLLGSVCVAPHQGCFGEDLYPTIFDKAAKYLIDFCRYQVFFDGNKRTGVLAMQMELLINGYDINMSNADVYDLAMSVATDRIFDVQMVGQRIRECCVPLEEEKVLE